MERIFIREDKIWEQSVLYEVLPVKTQVTITKRRCPLLMALPPKPGTLVGTDRPSNLECWPTASSLPVAEHLSALA